MAGESGPTLLNAVAERIIARWLELNGRSDVEWGPRLSPDPGPGVDLTFASEGLRRRAKVKADPYYGRNTTHAQDRSLSFYRTDHASYAMESIANASTRDPGWIANSVADELFYYFVAITQPEDIVRFLLNEPDDLFFRELQVERDELVILPMKGVRTWFDENSERCAPRPVVSGASASWNRLVPRVDLESGVGSIQRVGSIFSTLGG